MPKSPPTGRRRAALVATALAGTLTVAAPPHAQATPVLVNPGFEQVTAAGLPEGWGPWKPAGNGTITVLDGAAADGSKALELKGDSADDRTAVGQRYTTPDPSRVQFFRVSFDERADGISGSSAGVRVQYVNAGVPLTIVGRTTGTHDWRHVSEYVSAPAGTQQLSIEPMLDSARGRLLIDNISINPVDAQGIATAGAQPTGETELTWTFSGLTGSPSAYEVHRSTDRDFTPGADTRIRTIKNFTAASDSATAPGTSYTYKVLALAADGTELGTTAAATLTTPAVFQDPQQTNVLSATRIGTDVRIAWRFKAGTTGQVTLYAGRRKVGSYDVADGGVTLTDTHRKGATAFTVTGQGGKATASLAGLQHPRSQATRDRIADARKAIEKSATPRALWQKLRERVAAGPAGYAGSPYAANCSWATEAAFAHRITGDAAYAAQAFDGFVAAERQLPYLTTTNLLESANCIVRLAQVYDWSSPAWSAEQRAQALDGFERTKAFFEVGHHPNIDLPDKASNWVAVIRGAELSMLLAVRGDGNFGLQEKRIAEVVDELRRHLDEAYADTGWDQEGLDYLSYGLSIGAHGIMAASDAGIDALQRSWQRPEFTNIIMHSLSLRPTTDRLQWGVGYPAGGLGAQPLFFEQVSDELRSSWLWHYERTVGSLSANPAFAGSQAPFAILYWPTDVKPRDPDLGPATVRGALLDDHGGSYQFRSRYQDGDDVLVGATNRNSTHLGWNGYETFGLSLISHDATWARQPAKDYAKRELFSKPLVDGRPERRSVPNDDSLGQGGTLQSRAYRGQGGGFVSLDGHLNYELSQARRDLVVDLRPAGGADSVIAVHDSFADGASHTYDWQLAPEAGTEITYGDTESGTTTFLFKKGDSWLKGWVLNADGAGLSTEKGAFKVTRTGTDADFKIVLAVGRGTPPTATTSGDALALGTTTYDLADLRGYSPAP